MRRRDTFLARIAGASPIAVLARLLLYVGLIAMFGAGIVGSIIAAGRAAKLVVTAIS